MVVGADKHKVLSEFIATYINIRCLELGSYCIQTKKYSWKLKTF